MLLNQKEEFPPRDLQFSFDWEIPLEQQQINDRDLNWPKYVKA